MHQVPWLGGELGDQRLVFVQDRPDAFTVAGERLACGGKGSASDAGEEVRVVLDEVGAALRAWARKAAPSPSRRTVINSAP